MIGAFSAGLNHGIGNAVGEIGVAHGATAARTASIALHGIRGGIVAELQGGKFGSGFVSAGLTDTFSPVAGMLSDSPFARAIVMGVIGGTISELSGDKFANGAGSAVFAELFNHGMLRAEAKLFDDGFESQNQIIRNRIAAIARAKVGSTDWEYGASSGPYGPNTNKCNLFAHDVLKMAGAGVPLMNGGVLYNLLGIGEAKYPILARQWADTNFKIRNWTVVTSPQAGDIAAIAADYSDATGHVGVVIRGNFRFATVSQTSYAPEISISAWGFRRNEPTPTFRRYAGD